MGKLIDRLKDPTRSGVYRARRVDDVFDATRGSDLDIARIALHGVRDKPALLEAVARVLEFPDWFGGNWDALEDCLTDLSWRTTGGHVLVFEGAQGLARDDFGVLIDLLSSTAEYWAGRGRPFFAVFVDGPAKLPPLMREKKA
jgi:RNAse (barnase) inhibitor barstar